MAVPGDPYRLEEYGIRLQGIPSQESEVPELSLPGEYGPISRNFGFARVAAQLMTAANEFRSSKDAGIVEAGRGLTEIAKSFRDIDRQGSDAILRLFPDSTPSTDGARR